MLEEALKVTKGKLVDKGKSWAVSRDQLRPVMFGENGNHGDASEITGNHGKLISGRVSARNRRVGEIEGKRNESERELNRRMCFLEENIKRLVSDEYQVNPGDIRTRDGQGAW